MSAKNIKSLVKSLESIRIFKWFSHNLLKGNGDKYHVLLIAKEKIVIKVDSAKIESTRSKKLLGVIIDSKLSFEEYTAQKMEFFIKDFVSRCDQIRRKLQGQLRGKCPNTEFFWSVFSRIWTEYRKIWGISLYSVQMRENTDQKKFRI